MAEDQESPLQRSLIELSAFLISERSVADTLTRVAYLAVEAVPPAMFAGITMMVDDRVDTQAFTDPMSPEIDQAQYESGHGPCLDAFRQRLDHHRRVAAARRSLGRVCRRRSGPRGAQHVVAAVAGRRALSGRPQLLRRRGPGVRGDRGAGR